LRTRLLLRAETGFGLIELMIACLILSIGIIALVPSFDSSRRLTTTGEVNQVASTIGQRELERIRSLPYSAVAITAVPPAAPGGHSPTDYLVTSGVPGCSLSNPCYQWDHPGAPSAANTEPLDVDSVNGDSAANPTAWSTPSPSGGTRVSGQIYRYITWVTDPYCTSQSCQTSQQQYKRVTIGVTVTSRQLRDPVYLSSLIRPDPTGAQNPLSNSGTTCLSGTQTVPCAY
jgi:Tfp pilus assembly protein PilV